MSRRDELGQRRPIRIERHSLGPRLHVFGCRLHEWQVGVTLLMALALAFGAGAVHPSTVVGALAVGAIWLVVKDWRDIFPSTRDTATWRLGVHRRLLTLRATRRAEWLPRALGTATAFVGAVNMVSALSRNAPWRDRLLDGLSLNGLVPLFHSLAVPTGAALVLVGFYVCRRRRRAWQLAVLLLALAGVFNLLKGFDFEEALLGWVLLGLLLWGGEAFVVRHDPLRVDAALWRVPALASAAILVSGAAVWAGAQGAPGLDRVIHEPGRLLLWSSARLRSRDEFGWVPDTVRLLGVATLVGAAYLLFRPLAAPRRLPDPGLRRLAADLVRSHGRDTLAFFKLREDEHYLLGAEGRAFVGYRVIGRVMLIAGDPVGPAEALPDLIREVASFAEQRGLRLACVGASEGLLELWGAAGLRSLYIGDEAVLDTARFSLEGRAVRKVRQSVRRLERAGYEAELQTLDCLEPETLERLEAISEGWRQGAPERGFSMAMDRLQGEHAGDSLVVLGRDADGVVRGFLHFVPTYGRSAMSLSFMRRERETPNGFMEYLVAWSVELLHERGTSELSLNFAAFARFMQRPENRVERAVGRAVSALNPLFQIESLYRFNAKFLPRWEPRYLAYEGVFGLPRAGLATLRAEGQLQVALPRGVQRPPRVKPVRLRSGGAR